MPNIEITILALHGRNTRMYNNALLLLTASFTAYIFWAAPRSPKARTRANGKFQAVSLSTRPGCCKEAEAQEGHRLLSTHAPSLPLAGCNAKRCQCAYTHYTDRRATKNDRRSTGQRVYFQVDCEAENRRSGLGRRKMILATRRCSALRPHQQHSTAETGLNRQGSQGYYSVASSGLGPWE